MYCFVDTTRKGPYPKKETSIMEWFRANGTRITWAVPLIPENLGISPAPESFKIDYGSVSSYHDEKSFLQDLA